MESTGFTLSKFLLGQFRRPQHVVQQNSQDDHKAVAGVDGARWFPKCVPGSTSSAKKKRSQDSSDSSNTECIKQDFNILDVVDRKPNKGVVLLARKRDRKCKRTTVLKVFPTKEDVSFCKEEREVSSHVAASTSKHPHIAAFLARHTLPTTFCIEMEYCDVGDLTHLSTSVSRSRRLDLVRQVASALHHMHVNLSMVHVDMKPSNVGVQRLSNGHLIAKLIDFGSAKAIGKWRKQGAAFGGTSHFVAPETFKDGPGKNGRFLLSPAIDIWGLGIIMVFLLTGRLPWGLAKSSDESYKRFSNLITFREDGCKDRIPLSGCPEDMPVVCYEYLLPGMLNPMPASRHTAKQVENIILLYLQSQQGHYETVDGVSVYVDKRKQKPFLLRLLSG